ncbi:MAG: hypothetical protein HN380_27755, partial [Victivallales bacterium]|nr:hypothetical protein [Victivallales bacterium]
MANRMCLAVSLALCCLAPGLGAQGSRADYARAAKLGKRFRGKVEGVKLAVAWSPDERELVYRQVKPGGDTEIVRLDLASANARPAF